MKYTHKVLGFGLVATLIAHNVFARLGESFEESTARYGKPTKEQRFDKKVIDYIEQKQAKSDYYKAAVPTRVCEYRAQGWIITTLFGRFIHSGIEKRSARQNNESLLDENEQAIAMNYKLENNSEIDKEAAVSLLLKEYDGPLGKRVLRQGAGRNEGIAYEEERKTRWMNLIIENYDKIISGEKKLQYWGTGQFPFCFYIKKNSVIFSYLPFSKYNEGHIDNCADECVGIFKDAAKEMKDNAALAEEKLKANKNLVNSEEAIGTKGL